MKRTLTLSLLVLAIRLCAQQFSPALQQVIDAENNFAGMAKEVNLRDAFIANLADSGIVFAKGKPVLAQEVWNKRKADNSLLAWWPVFSDVSAAGDMGYNTGPFEWSKDRSAKPLGFGYFSSVWKKDKQGIWKVAIDMGMGLPVAEEKSSALATSKKNPIKAKGKIVYVKAKKDFLDWDKAYDGRLNSKSISFLTSDLSDEARIHHTGNFPAITPKAIKEFSDGEENYQFEQLGGDMALSGDLAYAYGNVKAVNKKEKKEVSLNYLRIWKKEDGKNWKIVLDVIGG